MWRFLLRQNISRYRSLLGREADRDQRVVLEKLLLDAEAEFAELEKFSTAELAKHDAQLLFFAQHAVEHAIAFSHAQFGNLQIYDPSSASLVIVAQVNFRAPFLKHFASVTVEDGSVCGRAFANRKRVTVDDVTTDPAFSSHLDVARAAGFRAVQSTPLFNPNGDPFGMLSIHYDAPRQFSDMDFAQLNRHVRNFVSHIGT